MAPIRFMVYMHFGSMQLKNFLKSCKAIIIFPKKLLPFKFSTTTNNGTQVHNHFILKLLPNIILSKRVKSLNRQKHGRKEEMRPCWWKFPNFLQNLFGLFTVTCFVLLKLLVCNEKNRWAKSNFLPWLKPKIDGNWQTTAIIFFQGLVFPNTNSNVKFLQQKFKFSLNIDNMGGK